MTPDAPPQHDPALGHSRLVRKKRRTHRPRRLLRDIWLPAAAVLVIAGIFFVRYLSHIAPAGQLTGYISSTQTLEQEYQQFEGKPMSGQTLTQQFFRANDLATRGEYKAAILALETLSKDCPLPVVFHDLGILYATVNEHDHALNAFREALARDPGYAAVPLSLASLRGFDAHSADPVPNEKEPNGTTLTSNLVSLERAVVGEISTNGDLDVYRFSAPRAPRDVLKVEVRNQSTSLAPALTIYDASGQRTGEAVETGNPGQSISLLISPHQNTTVFAEVTGTRGTAGAYAFIVTATRAFDPFEPNDDIASAHKIPVGREIEANIMNTEDNDYYSFVSDHGGKMVVSLQSDSTTLTPGLAIFGPNQQPMQYAVQTGESSRKISRSVDVEENQVYYVQVWGQGKTTGTYRLLIQAAK